MRISAGKRKFVWKSCCQHGIGANACAHNPSPRAYGVPATHCLAHGGGCPHKRQLDGCINCDDNASKKAANCSRCVSSLNGLVVFESPFYLRVFICYARTFNFLLRRTRRRKQKNTINKTQTQKTHARTHARSWTHKIATITQRSKQSRSPQAEGHCMVCAGELCARRPRPTRARVRRLIYI